MSFSAAEADRRIANLMQIGTVVSIDNGTGRAVVRIGDLVTPAIPVMQIRSGTIRLHWMPSPGEQVTVASPSGDVARAIVLGSIATTTNMIAPGADRPTMDLGGGTLRIIGKVYVDGDIEVTGDVVASGISLVHHLHGGVAPGSAKTGAPE